jgi:tellurite methyltransferase
VEPDWDQRYREGFYDGADDAHQLLQQFWPLIRKGPVLDIACGNGRDIIYLAGKGHSCLGLDRSREALKIAGRGAQGKDILLVQGDAGALPFKKGLAAGVLVFYFLERGMAGRIPELLKKGGILVYETFLERQNAVDRRRNPEHLLADGELYGLFSSLEPLFYEETVTFSEGKTRAIARFVGRKQ